MPSPWSLAALLALCLLPACSSSKTRTQERHGDPRGRATVAATTRTPPACPPTVVTGDSIGPLHIGAGVEAAHNACRVLRDTTMHVEYSDGPARVLSFQVGSDVVVAQVERERIGLIEVSSPRLRTRDSLGVGTTLERLLHLPALRGHFYAGRMYLDAASHCGLVFELAAPSVRLPESTLDSAKLAGLPGGIVVDRLRVDGCAETPTDQPDTITAVRTDTVFLARDLDSSGTVDYVVRESRLFDARFGARTYRLAVYLDSVSTRRTASWATDWDEEFGSETSLGQWVALGSDGTALVLVGGGGDYASESLLLVRQGSVRRIATHGEEYGNGFFDVGVSGGVLSVDASLDHLDVPGSSFADIPCKGKWAAVRLTYHIREARFSAEQPRCVRIPRGE